MTWGYWPSSLYLQLVCMYVALQCNLTIAECLAFPYLHCLLPLLLQGIKHDPTQLLDIMLLPS